MTPADRIAEHPSTGATCSDCGFRYYAHRGHIIACPVCRLACYESMTGLPEEPNVRAEEAPAVLWIYINRLSDYAVAMKAKCESALDDALRKSQAYTEAAEHIETLKAENESLRAECGLRQIQGYNEGKKTAEAALATARQNERERIIEVCRDNDCYRAITAIEALIDRGGNEYQSRAG